MKTLLPLLALTAVLALTLAACDSGVTPDSAAPELDARDDFAFSKDHKTFICHVGNEEGDEYTTYRECAATCAEGDLECLATCPDAGKIDLVEVPNPAKHIGNPSHCYDANDDGEIGPFECDYEPGVGNDADPDLGDEDTDEVADGVDDGCEIPVPCPCFSANDIAPLDWSRYFNTNDAFFGIAFEDQSGVYRLAGVSFPAFLGDYRCVFSDYEAGVDPVLLILTEEEGLACQALVVAEAEAEGLLNGGATKRADSLRDYFSTK